MKKLILFTFLFLLNINYVYAKEEVKFSSCVDGDTIKVLLDSKETTVRLLAVDTPESVHPKKEVEYYGKEASDYTCNLITNAKKLELEYDDNSDKKDKYDRVLSWVFVDDELLEDLLIKEGYAKVAYLYGDYKYTELLEEHQKEAELKKIGIWNEEENSKWNDKEENVLSIDNIFTLIGIILLGALITFLEKKYKKYIRKVKKFVK